MDYFVIMFLSHHHTRLDLTDMHFLKSNEENKNKNWVVKKKTKWEYRLYIFKTAKHIKDLPIILKAEREENTFLNKYSKLLKAGDPILITQKGKNILGSISEKELQDFV